MLALQPVAMTVLVEGGERHCVESSEGVVDLCLTNVRGCGIVSAESIVQLRQGADGAVRRSVEATALLAAVRPLVATRATVRSGSRWFPYQDSLGKKTLMSLAKRKAAEDNEPHRKRTRCPRARCIWAGGCLAMVQQKDMRVHVALHLIRKYNLGAGDAALVRTIRADGTGRWGSAG